MMKAILLTGGRGTRLRPLTHTSNKHVLPIANHPLISYPFQNIVDAGIKEIAVIVNETRKEIEEILGNGKKFGVKITYIFQDHPGGLAHAMSLCEEFVGKDRFVLVLGDNLLQNGIKSEVKKFTDSSEDAHLYGIKYPVSEHKRLGMATVDKNFRVLRYIEKPGVVDMSPLYDPENSYAVPGYYFFTAKVFQCFHGKNKIQPSVRGEYEISAPYNWLIENGYKNIGITLVTGWWKDPGNFDDMLAANNLVLKWKKDFPVKGTVTDSKIEGDVEIMEKSTIKNATLRGPISIGRNVVIENSYIGPYTSIGDDTIVKNSSIENSIIMGDAKITNVKSRLDKCLIGWYSEVTERIELPKASSLFIGDDSKVII